MAWFVLSVKRKNEIRITSELDKLGYRVYCPTTVTKQWSDRVKNRVQQIIFKFCAQFLSRLYQIVFKNVFSFCVLC